MVGTEVILLIVVNAFLSCIGTIANVLVFLVVFKNQEMRNELNLLIASLALADLCVCLAAQPMYIVTLSSEESEDFKYAFECTALFSLHASFNNLTGITINRMAVLLHPFSYTMSHHRKRFYAGMLGGIWVSSVVLTYYFTTDSGRKISPYVHTVMFSMFILSFAYIFCVARKQVRKIASQMHSVSFNHKAMKIRSENSAAKTSAILVSTSLVCFFPDIVFDYLHIVDEMRFKWSFTLLFLSSAVNPCIYVWRNERFRLALLRTIHCIPALRDRIISSNRVNPWSLQMESTNHQKGVLMKGKASIVHGQGNCSIEDME
ncbi:G-protein coupled receptor 83-like [Oculina patagonica]